MGADQVRISLQVESNLAGWKAKPKEFMSLERIHLIIKIMKKVRIQSQGKIFFENFIIRNKKKLESKSSQVGIIQLV